MKKMKTKICALGIAALIVLMITTVPGIADTADDPFATNLTAGGGSPASAIKVGDVEVWNDGENLYVKYNITEDDWYLAETHLHVATELTGIPQTKKFNPIPGQFDYTMEHDCVTEYIYVIPLAWPMEAELDIAAHAEVVHISGECMDVVSDTEVQWSDDGSTWQSAVACWVHESWADISDATWIWRTYETDPSWEYDNVPVGGWYFNKTFTLPDSAFDIEGSVDANADNAYTIAINSVSLEPDGEGEMNKDGNQNYEWTTVVTHSVPTSAVQPGLNEIQLRAMNHYNTGNSTTNPAGLIFGGQICYTDKLNVDQDETAWGDGIDFAGKNWATYFTYTV